MTLHLLLCCEVVWHFESTCVYRSACRLWCRNSLLHFMLFRLCVRAVLTLVVYGEVCSGEGKDFFKNKITPSTFRVT